VNEKEITLEQYPSFFQETVERVFGYMWILAYREAPGNWLFLVMRYKV